MIRLLILITTLLSTLPLFAQQALEIPTITNPEAVIYHEFYTLQYNETFEQADWVAYELTFDEVMGETDRKDSFKVDPNIELGSASLNDYKGSGYD